MLMHRLLSQAPEQYFYYCTRVLSMFYSGLIKLTSYIGTVSLLTFRHTSKYFQTTLAKALQPSIVYCYVASCGKCDANQIQIKN